jgi:S-adenosylmethionine-diacylgycerolhomoserine-N-methlytransferase
MTMSQISHAGLMDRVYRHQRHFYDATRKYYLVGRDPMLAGLAVPQGGSVLEIGCGTGRNLVKVGELYPHSKLFGIDISQEMLRTAGKAIVRAGLESRTRMAQADAAQFDPKKVFGREKFDRIFISYAVSMIPSWQAVMANAASCLSPGGELHVVDFGDLRDLPRWSKAALYTWLRWYHVTPRATLFHVGSEIADRHGGVAEALRLYQGFSWISVIRIPDRQVAASTSLLMRSRPLEPSRPFELL